MKNTKISLNKIHISAIILMMVILLMLLFLSLFTFLGTTYAEEINTTTLGDYFIRNTEAI